MERRALALHRTRMRHPASGVLPIAVGFVVLLAGCNSGAHKATPVSSLSSVAAVSSLSSVPPVSSPPPPWFYSCTTGVGEGCGAPKQITGPLWTDATRQTISGHFACGGALLVKETATEVVLTFIPQVMMPGGAACGFPVLIARLAQPLGTRPVVDAATGTNLLIAAASPSPWP